MSAGTKKLRGSLPPGSSPFVPFRVLACLSALISILLIASCGRSDPPERGPDADSNQSSATAPTSGKHAVPSSPIQVRAAKVTSPSGRIEYRYTVLNRSAYPITTLLVGYDEYYGRPQLSAEPYGWDGDNVPSSSSQSPPGWEFTPRPTEEDSLIYINWEITDPERAIQSGDSLSGYAVIVDREDPAYGAGGLWTAYVRGQTPFWGALQSE
jgi:hypothetical protein